MLKNTQNLIKDVGKHLGLSSTDVDYLLEIDQLHQFDIELSNGKSYPGFRSQHNRVLGPYKGGIRFHPEVDLNEVKALSMLMSLKTAAVGLPLGGGKGGVAVDPRELSAAELEELSRAYARHLHKHIGPGKDIPAPDVNTNGKIIDWMVDEFEQLTGDTNKASFTGKSVGKGGSLGREAATGRGGVLALKEVLEAKGLANKPLTYAIQGFGNVGLHFSLQALELLPHLQLVAATDSSGGIAGQLNVKELQMFKESGKKLYNFDASEVSQITNEQIIEQDADILVLAALGGVITTSNSNMVKARYVLELANGPVEDVAEAQLEKRQITVIPDILANAGGVTVSYLEYQQNLAGESWTEDKVETELAHYLLPAVKDTIKKSEELSVSLRHAALAKAIERILSARG